MAVFSSVTSVFFIKGRQHNLETEEGREASVQGVSGPDRSQLGEHTLETGKEAESSYAPDSLEGCFLFLDSQLAQQYRLCFFIPQRNWKQLVMFPLVVIATSSFSSSDLLHLV